MKWDDEDWELADENVGPLKSSLKAYRHADLCSVVDFIQPYSEPIVETFPHFWESLMQATQQQGLETEQVYPTKEFYKAEKLEGRDRRYMLSCFFASLDPEEGDQEFEEQEFEEQENDKQVEN